MPIDTIQDEGQTLPPPDGKLLGIVDSRDNLGRLSASLKAAGLSKIKGLSGDDGVALLERVD